MVDEGNCVKREAKSKGGTTPHSRLTTAVISVMYGRPYMSLRGCNTPDFQGFKVVEAEEGG